MLPAAGRDAGCGKLVKEGRHADGDSHSDRAARGILPPVEDRRTARVRICVARGFSPG
ncbi:hypothetical protein SBA4_3420016 [Candidatus Sulfopaludibacter sp. SbA4]|nr:hypothetical protein SBA4_3420016 [Candidatus Sulfopaludibacter sp. SbA4]